MNNKAMDPRTRFLLKAPIASTLLRLAMPNVLVMIAQAGAGGAWFGSLRWPWSSAAALQRRSPI